MRDVIIRVMIYATMITTGMVAIYLVPSVSVYEKPKLTHAQEVWKSALEWCESRGKMDAINPKDRDGTASYASWQFKPETLEYYAEKYGIATSSNGVMDYEVQSAVVEGMIAHRKEIDWRQQFPDCVKNKIGMPPSY